VNRKDPKSDGTGDWVCAPFEIVGICRDPNGKGWGLLLHWKDADRRIHTRAVGREALHNDPSALSATLERDGLKINPSQQRAFRTYLSGCNVVRLTFIIKSLTIYNP